MIQYLAGGMSVDEQYNPFYVKYSPDENGYFDGQKGYGYVSLEKFIGESPSIPACMNSR